MEEKISVSEINRLREIAEKERTTHREIMKRISQHSVDRLSEDEQMEIAKRGNKREIEAMLKAFNQNGIMSSSVQVYLYQQPIGFDAIRKIIIDESLWSFELEKVLIDKGTQFSVLNRKISSEGEIYLLQHALTESLEKDSISSLKNVDNYLSYTRLSEAGEVVLMSYLNVMQGRDSLIDKCQRSVRDYIYKYKNLTLKAQHLLIQSGNHEAIMDYITYSTKGLELEDELLERGNREEVEAYFKRYATFE